MTAERGAALQDFIRVLRNNKFNGRIFVYNAIVQGPRCADSVAAGIRFFDSPFYLTIDNNENIITNKVTIDNVDDNTNDNTNDNANKNNLSDNDSDYSIDPFAPELLTSKHNSNDMSDDMSNDISDNIFNNGKNISNKKHIDILLDEGLTELKDEYEQIDVDVVVITRGGGSFEDLMGFSDSKVLDAVYNSKHYTISSVGHEVDDMLSDFVANCSVGTPSMAGDAISKSCSKIHDRLNLIEKQIISKKQKLIKKLYSIRHEIVLIENSLEDPIKKIIDKIQNIQKLSKSKIWDSINRYLIKNKSIINKIAIHDSKSLLKNGFSVIVNSSGQIVRDGANLFGQELKLIHETGEYTIKMEKITDS